MTSQALISKIHCTLSANPRKKIARSMCKISVIIYVRWHEKKLQCLLTIRHAEQWRMPQTKVSFTHDKLLPCMVGIVVKRLAFTKFLKSFQQSPTYCSWFLEWQFALRLNILLFQMLRQYLGINIGTQCVLELFCEMLIRWGEVRKCLNGESFICGVFRFCYGAGGVWVKCFIIIIIIV